MERDMERDMERQQIRKGRERGTTEDMTPYSGGRHLML